MIEHPAIHQIGRTIVEEARTDTVGLWAVLWEVKQNMPALEQDEAKRATLSVVREALATGEVVAGGFADKDEDSMVFVPWPFPVDETLRRIDREWVDLGREPNPGEIAWFVDPGLLPLTARKDPMGKDWRPA